MGDPVNASRHDRAPECSKTQVFAVGLLAVLCACVGSLGSRDPRDPRSPVWLIAAMPLGALVLIFFLESDRPARGEWTYHID